jgi:hypothetical protein
MRQLKVDLGLLVGNEIHVYYDGSLISQSYPIVLPKIPFNEESEDGQLLIEFIDRESFINQDYSNHLVNWINQYNNQINITQLKNTLLLPSTNEKILHFLRNEFSDYGQEVIEATLEELEIQIVMKSTPKFTEGKTTKPLIEIQGESNHLIPQNKYVNFFSDLIDRIKKQISSDWKGPSHVEYRYTQTGINGVHFEWFFHGRPRSLGVELHFEKSDKKLNIQMIERLEHLKDAIEQNLGEKVTYQKDWRTRFSRLFVEKKADELTEELKTWAVEKMVALIRLLQPEIDKMK